ncbi:MAG: PQQ-binding-like beta-propeller repeat protein, partial [Bryobacteraceae bacterium]
MRVNYRLLKHLPGIAGSVFGGLLLLAQRYKGETVQVEPDERHATSEYLVIPAARTSELTRALDRSHGAGFRNWHRPHGDTSSSRFSLLNQINRSNVRQLEVAWVYHSKDGTGNIQCNPIIVNGVMYAPTAGHRLVAINAESGQEIWSFRPGGRPAHRGLLYWGGN